MEITHWFILFETSTEPRINSIFLSNIFIKTKQHNLNHKEDSFHCIKPLVRFIFALLNKSHIVNTNWDNNSTLHLNQIFTYWIIDQPSLIGWVSIVILLSVCIDYTESLLKRMPSGCTWPKTIVRINVKIPNLHHKLNWFKQKINT